MARPTTLANALVQLEQLSARLSLASSLFHQHTGKHLSPLLDAALPATAYLSPTSPRPAAAAAALPASLPPAPNPAPAPAPAPPSTSAPAANSALGAGAPPSGNSGSEERGEKEAFDLSPLVLRALAIRKAVHVGEVEDGERAVAELVAGLPLTEAQKDQLRTWAGL